MINTITAATTAVFLLASYAVPSVAHSSTTSLRAGNNAGQLAGEMAAREVKSLTVAWAHKDRNVIRSMIYDDLPAGMVQAIRHPDRKINASQQPANFGIVFIEDVLRRNGLATSPTPTSLSVIGMDGYAVELSLAEVVQERIGMSRVRNDRTIGWREGAPLLLYTQRSGSMEKGARDGTWWVWWVSGVVIGELYPELELQSPDQGTSVVRLNPTLCPAKQVAVLHYPRGRRKRENPPKKQLVSYCELTRLASQVGVSSFKRVEVTSLNGSRFTVERELERYVVNYLWGDHAIRVPFGGPLQLCKLNDPGDCRYFVSRISFD